MHGWMAWYFQVDGLHINCLNERNQAEIKRIEIDIPVFPFEAESYIGNHLMKTVVFNTYLEDNKVKAVFQGLRWDEQAARTNDEYFEDVAEAELTPAHTRYRPILHFTERDIWDTTLHFEIPYCKLYHEGYRSLGAKTTSNIAEKGVPAWEQDLENTIYSFTLEDGATVRLKGNETVEYDGEAHTAANLYDALKEGYYGKF